jgi:hypothetical protein
MKTTTLTINPQSILSVGILAGLAYYGILDKDFGKSFQMKAEPSTATSSKEIPQMESFEDDYLNDMNGREIEAVFSSRLASKNKQLAVSLARQVQELSARYRISPSIVLSVINEESTFRIHARSYVGAMGLMQLRPTTAKYIAKKYGIRTYRKAADLANPIINITVGVAYLHYLRERFGNSIHYVAAYNMGPTAVAGKISNKTFALGKLEKYVSEIHKEAKKLRHGSKALLIAESN